MQKVCKKASSKLDAFARITLYTVLEKKKTTLNSFFNAQITVPIWMLSGRTNNNKIKHLNERFYD